LWEYRDSQDFQTPRPIKGLKFSPNSHEIAPNSSLPEKRALIPLGKKENCK